MPLNCGFDISISVSQSTPLITLLNACDARRRDIETESAFLSTPSEPAPMDFSAWCEVYLGGRWCTFDARHNKPRIGRIMVAHGRDGTDVPLVHRFGPPVLKTFKVWTDEVVALTPVAA